MCVMSFFLRTCLVQDGYRYQLQPTILVTHVAQVAFKKKCIDLSR